MLGGKETRDSLHVDRRAGSMSASSQECGAGGNCPTGRQLCCALLFEMRAAQVVVEQERDKVVAITLCHINHINAI